MFLFYFSLLKQRKNGGSFFCFFYTFYVYKKKMKKLVFWYKFNKSVQVKLHNFHNIFQNEVNETVTFFLLFV